MKTIKAKTFKATQKVFIAHLGLYGLIGYIKSVEHINNRYFLEVWFPNQNDCQTYMFDTEIHKIEII